MPLDPKLNKFSTASQAVVSYSYTDVADGTGVQNFFGIYSRDSTGDITFLNQVATTTTLTNLGLTNGVATVFDLTAFNSPRDVTGTAYILASMISGDGDHEMTFRIQHWDGTTATTIGTVESNTISEVGGTKVFLLPADLIDTHFATGDILRLTVTPNATQMRLTVSESSPLRLSIPFELQL